MEPWLDGLSEEWKSEHAPSSPRSSMGGRSNTSRQISSNGSQSRIPHLAHNIRNASNSSFLKPRSSRGIARQKENNALGERSPSSLNALPISSPISGSKRRAPSTIPLPRRSSSSSMSASQTSVQHHTMDRSSGIHETPEWKKRLQAGTELTSDGVDLFSPSKLEGMFKQSSCPVDPEDEENDASLIITTTDKRPWNFLNDTAFPPPSENFASYRTSKNRPSGMGTLQEVEEEDEDRAFDLSAISSIIGREPVEGIVRRRVSNLELVHNRNSPRTSHDPRLRTISGRKEMSDEVFSPLEDSEKSSVRKQALHETLDTNSHGLRRRLREIQTSRDRSKSPCSDHDISYDAQGLDSLEESILPEELAAEMTSQSLPEDLSMGTQNYQPNSILEVMTKRQTTGASSSSVIHRKATSIRTSSHPDDNRNFRSSPPPYRTNNIEDSRLTVSEPSSPADTSVVHHAPTSTQYSTTGSPLKLFGNRDTYTNNKLMRVLSQFEEDQSEPSMPEEAAAFRMSNFGKGELDAFGFDKQIDRPPPQEMQVNPVAEKVFKGLASSNVAQHNTTTQAEAQSSPVRERSTKRRRTLLKDEIVVDGTEVEVKLTTVAGNSLAGKKRRDALPGKDPEQASPDTMASRPVLRPAGSRKSSSNSHTRTASASEALLNDAIPPTDLAQQLAGELESFVKTAAEIKQDSRKASLATKDYMEEANKVMEFIRARGKPKLPLPDIQEPQDISELNPDAILDLEVDDSTKDSFSRPPSREGRVMPKPDRRYALHDAQTAKHLNKFRDPDDLELLASTSALGTLHLVDNKAVEEAALVPVPEDDQLDIGESFQSDPPGIRILDVNDRKRKYSLSDADSADAHLSQNIHSSDSKRTINTTSSVSTGTRGMISQGTVTIPDTIGAMMFDQERQIWVKQNIRTKKIPAPSATPESKAGREYSEADPFDGIPDLSIDETKEANLKKSPKQPNSRQQAPESGVEVRVQQPKDPQNGPRNVSAIFTPGKSSMKSPRKLRPTTEQSRPISKGSEASKHEERLHDGIASEDVGASAKQQPRVVTIAFSSPIASEIPYTHPPSISDADLDQDDPSLLPLDDEGSVLASSPARVTEQIDPLAEHGTSRLRPIIGSTERHEQYRAMTLNRRPVSRIDEYSEDQEDNRELSLVHIKHTDMTPLPERQMSLRKASARKESSILCLTPLSDFTLHQADKANHPEESFVAERANPKALRQAHGSHALVEDDVVKAITDAEPSELFWEQLRRLSLQKSGLGALHGLKTYCSALEHLDVRGNKVSQLTDLPISLRSLNVSSNMITDMTSWTHLHNLQSIDVSGNQLESLQCFSGLIHLRHLKASDNKIHNLEAILDLSGLVTLDLSGNDIPDVDFVDCELTSLEELDLSRNNLVHAKNLYELPKLKYLDLSENLLEELVVKGDKIVPKLVTLCLGQNEIAELDLTAFPLLERLNIDCNNIKHLPGLTEAEHLKVLSARDQRVASSLVNDVLGTSHDCTELYLSANALTEGEIVLPRQPNFTLRCLELASCGVHVLPQRFGDHFPNLRVFNLNFNALSDLLPLQGAIKLKQLCVAKNRIKKMRRTCLTISRLPALKKVDLRDNPLTVGFYAPLAEERDEHIPQCLPARIPEQDKRWLGLMDEVTWLRRRAMELLLADRCQHVEEIDGLALDREVLKREKSTWERLMRKGVLMEREKEASVRVTENAFGSGIGRKRPLDGGEGGENDAVKRMKTGIKTEIIDLTGA
ncbi:Protein nud1 [Lithohypha guttulata]|uniref:Protein nud1 n=1 Tax=Lithohypha guttulata TaxID=1690604 RepID=A0AAN7SX50_9EURO|nr:Protein nud1 [Lithohypha guttulata]